MAAVTPFSMPFLQCPCEPALPFNTWLKIFQNYLQVVATSFNEWSDSQKWALPLHCLENRRTETLYTLPDQDQTLDEAISALKAHVCSER